MDAFFLQVMPVVSSTVNSVTQHTLWIISVTLFVGFNLCEQIATFMEGIPADVVNTGNARYCQANTQFGAKFSYFVCFATYDGAYMGLVNTDDTVTQR